MKNRTYKKIDVEAIRSKIGNESWELLRKEINLQTGYIDASRSEITALRNRYCNNAVKNDSFGSYLNAIFAKTYFLDGKEIEVEDIEVDFKNLCFIVDGEKYSFSRINMIFECPACDKDYKKEGNPARWPNLKSSICKNCQKKQLHSCKDVIKNYENGMLQTHGTKYPIQNAGLRNKIKGTMKKRYGSDWAMQSESVRKKHSDNMLKKYGYRNYFCKENLSFVQTDFFYSRDEREMASYIVELLGSKEEVHSCLTQQKFVKTPEGFFSPDVYIPALGLIFEYYGDYWHAHPSVKRELFSSYRTREQVYEYDKKRNKLLEDVLNAKVVVIWEHDWLQDKVSQKHKIEEVINDRKKNS